MKFIFKRLGQIIAETTLENGHTYIIGRHKDCDFILQDETLSRKHVKIYQSESSQNWVIECFSTKGGLIFQGEDVDGLELEDSVSLALQNYTFDFVLEQEAPQSSVAEASSQGLPAITPQANAPADLPASLPASLPANAPIEENHTFTSATQCLDTSNLIYSLYIYIENESADHVELEQRDTWVIGRSEACDIFIDYKSLSRNHLKITKLDSQFTVEDLGGSNGSSLNDSPMQANKSYPFVANDRIAVGDLNLVFEIRDKDFEQKITNLPTTTTEEEDSSQNIMPFPKVILEEETEDEEDIKKSFFNKKKILMFGIGFIAIGMALFFGFEKEDEQEIQAAKQDQENATAIRKSYDLARQFLQEQKYQFCIDEIKGLHNLTPYYEDSAQILTACETAAQNKKILEEAEQKEKKKKETEEKIQKLAQECLEKEPTFQTIQDVNMCASEILQLDPSNSIISNIKRRMEDKEIAKRIKADKKTGYKNLISGKRFLFYKAKKVEAYSEQTGHAEDLLKAVAAYKRFIKASGSLSALAQLRKTAQEKVDTIQSNHDKISNELYSKCENLINAKKMKLAYYECKKILKFKPEDRKSIEYMNKAARYLRDGLKEKYEKSVMKESLSNVDEAQHLWKQIIEQDIKEGHYYIKADVLLKKYR